MAKPKPRVIKSYEKIDEKLRELINQTYPNGYHTEIQTYDIGGGKFMSALPLETDEFSYLIKFPVTEDIEEDQENYGTEDELNLEGGEDVEEDDDEDDLEKPTDNMEDLEVADDEEADL